MSDHVGRVVIVTGAGSGIGAATAALLVAEGATVAAADLDCSGVPRGCKAHVVDVTDEDGVAGFVGATLDEHGRIDSLANVAGIGSTSSLLDCSSDEWDPARLFVR